MRYDDDYIDDEPRARARPQRRKASKPAKQGNSFFGAIRRRPGRAIGAGLFVAILGGIVVNATLMQSARHPAPLFTGGAPTPAPAPTAAAAPAPAPTQAAQAAPVPVARSNDLTALIQATTPRGAGSAPPRASVAAPLRAVAPRDHAEAATAHKDVIAALLKTEPATRSEAAPEKSSRVAAVQRALQKVGYVARPDGVFNAPTKQAIERFEKDRGLTVTGSLSPRTIKELAAQSGVAIP
jgi:hypothetical protein